MADEREQERLHDERRWTLEGGREIDGMLIPLGPGLKAREIVEVVPASHADSLERQVERLEKELREIASYHAIHPLRDKARAFFPDENFDSPTTDDYKRARGVWPADADTPEQRIRRLREPASDV